MNILGIETSCDETGIAIYNTEKGLLAHKLHSQIALHRKYGGVVPELASRDHIRKILPLVTEVLTETGLNKADLDGIAYTKGPGLVGALMVGAAVAHSLGFALNIPVLGVHHMEGHLLAPMLEVNSPDAPFIALLVSGGHTQLIHVKALGEYELLGESIDDAAGEAFDKTAKLMGLPYPGGPELAKLALRGRPGVYKFPRPMTDRPGLDFSFSGLKTHARNTYFESDKSEQAKADIARAFQDAVVDTLLIKVRRALRDTHEHAIVVAGGVSANQYLRESLAVLADKHNWQVFFPRQEFCTDNGAMIAYVGAMRLAKGEADPADLSVVARWPLAEL